MMTVSLTVFVLFVWRSLIPAEHFPRAGKGPIVIVAVTAVFFRGKPNVSRSAKKTNDYTLVGVNKLEELFLFA